MSIRKEIRALPRAPKDFRRFGFVVGGVLVGLGALALYREAGWGRWALGLGAALAVLAAVAPKLLRPLYFVWMTLAVLLGFVMTRVILSVFFFLVLTPVGLIMRLFGHDPLQRRIDRQAASYWIPKKYLIPDRSRLEKYF